MQTGEAPTSRRSLVAQHWSLFLFIGVFVLWAAPIAVGLHRRWMNAGFEHGYPIFFMSLYLVLHEYRRTPLRAEVTSWPAQAVLISCVIVTFVAQAIDINIIPHILLPFAIFSAIWALAGRNTAMRFVFPILFIYFAIPFWQIADFLPFAAPSLNEGLRMLTTDVVSLAIRATAIPAYIDGNFIEVPYGKFEIAEGCSGRAFFIVGVELALFFGLAYLRLSRHRLLLLGIVAGIALLANWIRVFVLVMVGYFTEMQHSLIQSHSTFGWLVFTMVVAPMIIVANRLESRERHGKHVTAPAASNYRPTAAVPIVGAAAIGFVLIAGINIDSRQGAGNDLQALIPPSIHGWRLVGPWSDASVPDFPGASVETAVWYQNQSARVGVFLADFPVQKEGSEAVYFRNRPAGSIGRTRQLGAAQFVDPGGLAQSYVIHRIEGETRPRLLLHGLRVAGTPALGQFHAKLLQLYGMVKGRSDAQVVILTTECDPDCESAEKVLREFAAHSAQLFGAAKAGRRVDRD